MAIRVTVTGLRELGRELRAVDAALPRELQRGLKRVAGEIVVPGARGLAASRTNPRWGTAAVNTIRALASQQRAQVAVGSQRVPWAAGHNFGSKRTRITVDRNHPTGRRSTNQFPRTKGFRNGDYALYETLARRQPQIVEALVGEIDDLLTRTWPT